MQCFIAAPDHLEALRRATRKLLAEGMAFEELIEGKVRQLDPIRWDEFISSSWPGFSNLFPAQRDMPRFIAAGGVFWGPVVAWRPEHHPPDRSTGL